MASNGVVLPLVALAFCCWAVYLGGLAAMQQDCTTVDISVGGTDVALGSGHMAGVYGFSAGLPCYKLYRFYWFIMSFEIVIVVALGALAAMGKLAQFRVAFLGLFAVATLLYIETTNAFLTAQSVPYYDDGQQLHRVRTTTAGAIMTAVVNCFLIIALGMEDGEAAPKAETKEANTV